MPITINDLFGLDSRVITQIIALILLLAFLIARSIYWRKSEKRSIKRHQKIIEEMQRKRFETQPKYQLWREDADND